MRFSDIIGQNRIRKQLVQSIQENRLSHAMLFLGPEGSGNLPLAIAMAQYIICEQKEEDACGQCNACKKAEKFIHPDIHFVFPVIGTDKTSDDFIPAFRELMLENPYASFNDWLAKVQAENKQANINKTECLHIIRKLGLKTFESDHKIVLVWLPEFLGKEGNRLLKIIEEPPPNTVFLFVSENQNRILNTILSRLQLIKVNRLNDDEIRSSLMQREGVEEQKARELSRLADGNYSEALRLLSVESEDNITELKRWLGACFKRDIPEYIGFTDEFSSWNKEAQKSFIQYALHFTRECVTLKFQDQGSSHLSEKELELAGFLDTYLSWEALEKMGNLLDKSYYYLERNVHAKIMMFNISNEISRAMAKKPQKA